ncbi:uncharacterized protein LOC112191201 [Rosa chinensis]|uniref:uncharacterized protein LOC112191201 n=1 Tax=Rosa chinensis TaxID=74649 RepID=UPI000D097E8F|nr:uncharacterized protein LOC112191201 [Rosa chinensis]
MSNLNKLHFVALEVSGRNYLKWTQDVKLHLTANKMRSMIYADNIVPEDMKARAMIFIRKHMEEALKVEYLAEEDPRSLWVTLEERFNHQRTINLPEARHDWQNIRFQDFKTVNEYNSEIYKIRSLLKFCGEELTEAYLLEKTFSTFPPSCMVLQQQYRERNFARFSEFVTVLLLTEKNNDLLLRNDQARPTDTRAVPLPEANAIAHLENNRASRNRGRGRGRRPERPRMEGDMGPEMAHMTVTIKVIAQGVEKDVDKAHMVETEMPRSNKLKLERMLARPVTLRISIIYVIDVEALTIGPAPAVQQMKR